VPVELVVEAIIVINFIGDICCSFQDIGPGKMSSSWSDLSRSLKGHRKWHSLIANIHDILLTLC